MVELALDPPGGHVLRNGAPMGSRAVVGRVERQLGHWSGPAIGHRRAAAHGEGPKKIHARRVAGADRGAGSRRA